MHKNPFGSCQRDAEDTRQGNCDTQGEGTGYNHNRDSPNDGLLLIHTDGQTNGSSANCQQHDRWNEIAQRPIGGVLHLRFIIQRIFNNRDKLTNH